MTGKVIQVAPERDGPSQARRGEHEPGCQPRRATCVLGAEVARSNIKAGAATRGPHRAGGTAPRAQGCATHDVLVTVNGPIEGGKRRVRNPTRLSAIRTVSFPNDHTAPPLRDGLKFVRLPSAIGECALDMFGITLREDDPMQHVNSYSYTVWAVLLRLDPAPWGVMNMTNFVANCS